MERDLERRLARLERQNRLLSVALAAGVISAIAYGCGTSSTPNKAADVVSARKFELVDSKGQSRGLFFYDEDGAGLSLDDSTGKVRIVLAASRERPSVELFDDTSKRRLALTAEREGSTVEIYDEAGHLRGTLGQYKDENWLAFQDRQGRVTFSAPDSK